MHIISIRPYLISMQLFWGIIFYSTFLKNHTLPIEFWKYTFSWRSLKIAFLHGKGSEGLLGVTPSLWKITLIIQRGPYLKQNSLLYLSIRSRTPFTRSYQILSKLFSEMAKSNIWKSRTQKITFELQVWKNCVL